MEINAKIIKFGNSQGITIPTKIAKLIDFNINDNVLIKVNKGNTITITKI